MRLHYAIVVALCLGVVRLGSEAGGQTGQQLVQQAQNLVKTGEYARALALARRAAQLQPLDDGTLLLASFVMWQVGAFDESERIALQAVRLNPRVPAHFPMVAFSAWGNRDLPRALEYSRRSLAFGSQLLGEINYATARYLVAGLSERERRLTWTFNPAKCQTPDGYVHIAAPSTDLPYQSAEYQVTGAAETLRSESGGNPTVRVKPNGKQFFQMTARVSTHAVSFSERVVGPSATAPLPEEVKPYLDASDKIDPKSPTVMRTAALVRGSSSYATVHNTLIWMKNNFQYDYLALRPAEEVLRSRKAECGGLSIALSALCRANGIPARPVWGMFQLDSDNRSLIDFLRRNGSDPLLFGSPNLMCGHVWTEVYLPAAGWVPVDANYPESLSYFPAGAYVRMYHHGTSPETSSGSPVVGNMARGASYLAQWRDGR